MFATKKLSDIAVIYNGNSINKKVKQEKYMNNVPGWNYIGTKDVDFYGTVTYKTGVIIPFSEMKFKTTPPYATKAIFISFIIFLYSFPNIS